MSEQEIAKALNGVVSIQSHLLGLRSQHQTLAAKILKSEQLEALKGGASGVTIPLSMMEFKTATSTRTANDPLIPSLTPPIDPGVRTPLAIRDLLPVFPTTNGAIEMPTKTAAAVGSPASVPDNTATGESAYTFGTTYEPVETIGYHQPVSKQILEDSGTLQAFLTQELLQGLAEVEQDQLLNGDGSGTLNGLITGATGWSNESPNISNEVDIIRSAMKQISNAKFRANAICLNPMRIPDEGCHLIHAKVATHSTGRLPPIPEQSCHP